MAQIIPTKDYSGAPIYLQTHERAVVDSNGVTLETKLANVTTPVYQVAWDGASAPVVANIPAGVTVTYDGNSYTGTLAASASTANKIYLVGDGNGTYDRYVSQLSGSTYSWVSMGSTQIDMSDKASAKDVDTLEQIVETEEYIDVNNFPLWNYSVKEETLKYGTSVNYKHDILPVNEGDVFRITSNSIYAAIAYWFTSDDVPVSGGDAPIVPGTTAIVIAIGRSDVIVAPAGAKFLYLYRGLSPDFPYTPQSVVKIQDGKTNELSSLREDVGDKELLQRYANIPIDVKVISGGAIQYSNFLVYSNANYSYCVMSVKPGEKYLVSAAYISSTARAVILTDGTQSKKMSMLDGSANNTAACGEITIPDGYTVMYVNGHKTYGPIHISKIEKASFSLAKQVNRGVTFTGNFVFQHGGVIDARVSSETFGQVIKAAASLNWGVSHYIDLRGIKKIKYYATTATTNANYGDVTGAVFYDENLNPMTEGVRLVIHGSAYQGEWIEAIVPEGAEYMRLSLYNSAENEKYTLYSITTSDVQMEDGSGAAIDYAKYLPVIAQFKWSTPRRPAYESNPLVMIHCSDLHGSVQNYQRLKAFLANCGDYIDEAIHTGDCVFDSWVDSSAYWDANVLNVIGNHDTSKVESGTYDVTYYAGKQAYDRYIAPFVEAWGITQPEGADENGYCYYYKDYATQAIRLVVLDDLSWNATQLAWFKSVLDDALTNELSIIVASHYPHPSSAQVVRLETNFASYMWLGSSNRTQEAMAAIDDYMEDGGKFICWLNGHSHVDDIFYVPEHKNQLILRVGTDSSDTNNLNCGDCLRLAGTYMRDLFNVVAFDVTEELIKIIRVGANTNKDLQTRNSLVLRYDPTGATAPIVVREN